MTGEPRELCDRATTVWFLLFYRKLPANWHFKFLLHQLWAQSRRMCKCKHKVSLAKWQAYKEQRAQCPCSRKFLNVLLGELAAFQHETALRFVFFSLKILPLPFPVGPQSFGGGLSGPHTTMSLRPRYTGCPKQLAPNLKKKMDCFTEVKLCLQMSFETAHKLQTSN